MGQGKSPGEREVNIFDILSFPLGDRWVDQLWIFEPLDWLANEHAHPSIHSDASVLKDDLLHIDEIVAVVVVGFEVLE